MNRTECYQTFEATPAPMAIERAHIKRRVSWTDETIVEAKAQVKAELQEKFGDGAHPERMDYILKRIDTLGIPEDENSLLLLTIYCTTALVWHERFGGLKDQEIQGILTLGFDALRTAGVSFQRSRFRGLYKDFLLIRAQIARKQGHHWPALWSTTLAMKYLSDDSSPREWLMQGNRNKRLGRYTQAVHCYESCLQNYQQEPLDEVGQRAYIEYLNLHRLGGYINAFEDLRQRIQSSDAWSSHLMSDLVWEDLCLETQKDGDASRLVQATRRNKSHFEPEYILEAKLWSLAVPVGKAAKRAYTLSTVKAYVDVRGQAAISMLVKALDTLEFLSDAAIPMFSRLERLGQLLEVRQSLLKLEHEFLVLLAAARVLKRLQVDDFFSLCLDEANALMMRMRSQDGLTPLWIGCDLQKA